MDGIEASRSEKTGKKTLASPSPVVVVRMGRGRTGGSTALDWIVQIARHQGRSVVVADGDKRNPTLAGLYPPGTPGGALQPLSEESPDVVAWINDCLASVASDRVSLVLDLGGGDRVLAEVANDWPIVEFCEQRGIQTLAIYVCGPDQDDFEHILSIHRAGYFRAARCVLILNEHLVPRGKTPAGAFDAILARTEFLELVESGMQAVVMPRLACMDHVRAAGLSLMDAVANEPGLNGKRLDPVRQFQVENWHKRMTEAFHNVGALEWLP